MPRAAKLSVGLIITTGALCCAWALADWSCPDPGRYAAYLVMALLASRWKMPLRGVTGGIPVSHVFVLVAILDCNYPQTILLACLVAIVQTGWPGRRHLLHVAFDSAGMALRAAGGYAAHQAGERFGHWEPLALAASVYFVMNSVSIAGLVARTEHKKRTGSCGSSETRRTCARVLQKLFPTWKERYFWAFAYSLAAAGVAAVLSWSNRRFGWQISALALPVIFLLYHSYRLYVGKLQSEKAHAEQMAAVHFETIEALALAIEAKDENSHQHLNRVQVYAVELGRSLGLTGKELQSLRTASILHDIGKLAVPEHILSKPGKLTPEEFEKMKIHPLVGAEILSRVKFADPVVPIVRAHHEKWDGSGYPDGLRGESIPMGARILAVVDSLDALSSDRQYRPGLPLDDAMAVIARQSGKSYDPRVVATLQEHYREWEKLALACANEHTASLRDLKGLRDPAPAADGERFPVGGETLQPEFLASIAAARQEAQVLFDLTQDLGNSLSLHETLSVLDSRLKRLIPYDAMAVYLTKGDCLTPAYVNGENFQLLASLEIPRGQGLAGWVAETGKPIINGDPSVEAGYLNDPARFTNLRSALAVRLESTMGTAGVLSLYRASLGAFHQDHLRVLLAVNPKISLAVENALKYEQASVSATTDALTGLSNSRSLFQHLDAELARAKRMTGRLAVLVGDLDGFKRVNDRFGHMAGNKVLKIVAAGLKQNCREYDCVARMGGDEFVLVLSSFEAECLPDTIKRLEQIAAEAGVEVCGEPLLALSIGAAFYPDDGSDAESLLAEADRRMYIAKQGHKTNNLSAASLVALDNALRPEGPKVIG
jgi:diguanylate cyclase (GGDEF)-like protein/putative nucleotidyltransferase with HDIG domain